jgi:hypothetical protein
VVKIYNLYTLHVHFVQLLVHVEFSFYWRRVH